MAKSGINIGTNYGIVTSQIVIGHNSVVTINGKTYRGSRIEQRNGRIWVDGADVTDDASAGVRDFVLNITVQGPVESIDGCNQVEVTGNVKKIKTVSGSVEVSGDVDGDVESVSGSIICGKVSGSVKTVSGSIRTR